MSYARPALSLLTLQRTMQLTSGMETRTRLSPQRNEKHILKSVSVYSECLCPSLNPFLRSCSFFPSIDGSFRRNSLVTKTTLLQSREVSFGLFARLVFLNFSMSLGA